MNTLEDDVHVFESRRAYIIESTYFLLSFAVFNLHWRHLEAFRQRCGFHGPIHSLFHGLLAPPTHKSSTVHVIVTKIPINCFDAYIQIIRRLNLQTSDSSLPTASFSSSSSSYSSSSSCFPASSVTSFAWSYSCPSSLYFPTCLCPILPAISLVITL